VKFPYFLTQFQVSIRDAEQIDLLASLVVEGRIFLVGTKFCPNIVMRRRTTYSVNSVCVRP
jgi:hypothetical protein